MMNRYEMIYIIDADLEETARKELIEKVSALITNNGGEIEKLRHRSICPASSSVTCRSTRTFSVIS